MEILFINPDFINDYQHNTQLLISTWVNHIGGYGRPTYTASVALPFPSSVNTGSAARLRKFCKHSYLIIPCLVPIIT